MRSWKVGECLVFDVNVEHDAANLGTEPRTVLLADVRVTPGGPTAVP